MGCYNQERILLNKRGPCSELSIEFKQDEHPVSIPPTLFNGGNAVAQATGVMEGIQGQMQDTVTTEEDSTDISPHPLKEVAAADLDAAGGDCTPVSEQ